MTGTRQSNFGKLPKMLRSIRACGAAWFRRRIVDLLAVLLTFGFTCLPAAAQTALPENVRAALRDLVANSPTMVPTELDFSNDSHRTLVEGVLSALDVTTNSRSSLTETLAKVAPDRPLPQHYRPSVANLGDDESDRYYLGPVTTLASITPSGENGDVTANAVVSMATQPVKCFGILLLAPTPAFESVVFDFVEQQIGCPNMQLSASGLGGVFADAAAAGESEPSAAVISVAEFSDGHVSLLADGAMTTTATGITATSTNPPENPPGNVIKVCVWRVASDCTMSFDRQTMVFPIDGGAEVTEAGVTFDPAFDASSSALIQRNEAGGGGGCYMFDVQRDPSTGLNIAYQDNDRSLTWAIDNIQMYNPDGCLSGQHDVNFYFQLTIKTQGSPTSGLMNIYVATPHYLSDPPDVLLPPMLVNWGCLAAGSMVLLEDGSEVAIEDLAAGDRVAAGPSRKRILTVEELTTGFEPHPLVVLTTESGLELKLTRDHPVPAEGAIYLARDLQPGMVLDGDAGGDRIAAIDTGDSHVPVYNLKLGNTEPPIGETEAEMTFVANGITVGDYNMQGRYIRPPNAPQGTAAILRPSRVAAVGTPAN